MDSYMYKLNYHMKNADEKLLSMQDSLNLLENKVLDYKFDIDKLMASSNMYKD